ncbi:histidine kinase [uncultured Polaribacter sp.]|uniref:sensor histidine kinase n=1 Tax=uncultured Polaribacter sp. TaxID=174711 RepID=UPI0026038E98|nr:histidine kinase [uncultured Polaribacter sp.]
MEKIKNNNWFLVKVLITLTIVIPIGFIVYEFISTGQDSIVLLADYPTYLNIFIILYYVLLILFFIGLLLLQLKSVLRLTNAKRKNELLHLQSQVNPHFFFNMLNNLYGLVDKDSEKAKELILKLSDLMRYSIYEGEKKRVSLEEEIEYLKNYIDLHKMRYHKIINIQFDVDVDKKEYQITPLLFIILLENAFKHGVENLRENAFVYLKLTAKRNVIYFEIENNFDIEEVSKEKGIGLKNLKRRLELAYPKKHMLTFKKENLNYKVKLVLEL